MIKVLHFGLSTNLGGIETYLYKLARNINKEEFQFSFLVAGDPEKFCFYKEFVSMGCQFFSITPRSKSLIKHKRDLENLYTTENFDVIHCHMNSLSNILPITMGIKHNQSVIVHSRNGQLSRITLKTKLLHEINSLLLPKKKVKKLAVSDLAGQWMFGKNSNFHVVNNGVEIDKYKYNEKVRKKVRKDLGINDEFCVLHIGAFRKQKNHMFLLEVFKHIKNIKPNSKLLLVGSGRLKSEIEDKIKELGIRQQVIMVGKTKNVSDYLSASDAFLFPSLFEGFPNAVLEAQTSGLPCLISNTITKEVLINSNCVSFPLSKEPKAWANKLFELTCYRDRLDGAKNIEAKGFSVRDEVIKVEKIYRELFNKKVS